MITAADAKKLLLEKEMEEFTIPEEVDKKLDEYIHIALDKGYSYTVICVPTYYYDKTDDVDKYIIDNLHLVVEYMKSKGYTTSVASETNHGRCICISW